MGVWLTASHFRPDWQRCRPIGRTNLFVTLARFALLTASAGDHRHLRQRGVALRKTRDLIIGTFCLERRHSSLHDNRDFIPMIEHLGLRAL